MFVDPSTSIMAVHPRACGEHTWLAKTLIRPLGSSPRMRGAHRRSRESSPARRFIPAHAGSTPRQTGRLPIIAVHPRACGEHVSGFISLYYVHGSSPRMRGAPEVGKPARTPAWFIPAHAGSTITSSRRMSCLSVHPRACGEHEFVTEFINDMDGSSPRMRGAHH